MGVTLKGENSADACRRLGWGVGTRIIGDEGYGPSVWEITAVGRSSILKMTVIDKVACGHEGLATLSCRDWVAVEEASK